MRREEIWREGKKRGHKKGRNETRTQEGKEGNKDTKRKGGNKELKSRMLLVETLDVFLNKQYRYWYQSRNKMQVNHWII